MKTVCPTCSGTGVEEVCTGCGEDPDDCACEAEPETGVLPEVDEHECPECNGEGSVDAE